MSRLRNAKYRHTALIAMPNAPRQPNFTFDYSARANSSRSNNSSSASGFDVGPRRRISSRSSTARSSAARPRYSSVSIGTTVSSGKALGSAKGFEVSASSAAMLVSISAADARSSDSASDGRGAGGVGDVGRGATSGRDCGVANSDAAGGGVKTGVVNVGVLGSTGVGRGISGADTGVGI